MAHKRITPLEMLLMACAAVATATAALVEWHRLFKPATLLIVGGWMRGNQHVKVS